MSRARTFAMVLYCWSLPSDELDRLFEAERRKWRKP